VRVVDSLSDPGGALEAAAAALMEGEIVAIPTDTLYGLAVRVGDQAALDRLFEVKQRPAERHVAVLVTGKEQALTLASEVPRQLERVMDRLWPGAVTVVLDAPGGTVGVRCPSHRWDLELLAATGPLSTTSANIHGQPPLLDAASIRRQFGSELALVIDGGRCAGAASTVVAGADDDIDFLRHGALEEAAVRAAAGLGGPGS